MLVLVVCNDGSCQCRLRPPCEAEGLRVQVVDQAVFWTPGAPHCDVVLLHARSHAGALRWTRIAKRARGALPLVVSVADLDSPTAAEVLDAGADDIFDASIANGELGARLRAVHRRSPAGPKADTPRSLQRGPLTLDLLMRTARIGGEDLRLRRAEYQLLAYLVVHGEKLVTAAELTESALGGRYIEGSNLIRVHLAHLRRKLGSLHASIRTVRGAGYVWVTSTAEAETAA